MSFEQGRDAEPASQHHLDYLMQLGGHCLVGYGQKNGSEPTYRLADQTAVYVVPDEKRLADIMSYATVIAGADLMTLNPELNRVLEVGSELDISYTPEHYLRTPHTGLFEWYSESIHATITTPLASTFKEKTFSVTYEDPDVRSLVGLRYTLPRTPIPVASAEPEGPAESLPDFIFARLRKNLSKMSKTECKALVDVMRIVGRLY